MPTSKKHVTQLEKQKGSFNKENAIERVDLQRLIAKTKPKQMSTVKMVGLEAYMSWGRKPSSHDLLLSIKNVRFFLCSLGVDVELLISWNIRTL